MASTESVKAGSYGRDLLISTGTDLSIYDTLELEVFKPGDNVATVWIAVVEGDAADGILKYTVQSGDLDEVGSYKIHARLTRNAPAMRVFGEMAVLKVERLGERSTN